MAFPIFIFPQFMCPLELADKWWIPLERAGFMVNLYADKHQENIEKALAETMEQGGEPTSVLRSGTAIFNNLRVKIDLWGGDGSECGCTIRAIGNEAISFYWEIVRILLASGMTMNLPFSKCMYLFHCSAAFVCDWQYRLPLNLELVRIYDTLIPAKAGFVNEGILYTNGLIKKNKSLIEVFTGNCIREGETGHYIALGYKDNWLNRKRYSEIVSNIKEAWQTELQEINFLA